jgi:hypothetical protein
MAARRRESSVRVALSGNRQCHSGCRYDQNGDCGGSQSNRPTANDFICIASV